MIVTLHATKATLSLLTKNQIIEQLFVGKSFNEVISKMEPYHLQDDLKMEVISVVCEWPEEKVVELYEKKQLEFYVARVIINQAQSNTSPFAVKYRKVRTLELNGGEVLPEYVEPIDDRLKRESLEDDFFKIINNTDAKDNNWYNKELLKLYLQLGSYRKVGEETKIPFPSVYKSIDQYKNHLSDLLAETTYTQKEAQKILGVTQHTLWNWRKIGYIESVKAGRKYLFSKKEVNRVLELRKPKSEQTQLCTMCGVEKNMYEFDNDKAKSNGKKKQCKPCWKIKVINAKKAK